MPGMSKETATKQEQMGPGRSWSGTLDGYSVSFATGPTDVDVTELLKGLPNDECPCPHWGYIFAGSMWFRSGDREEEFRAGEAFFVGPGHTSGTTAGTEFLIFSPSELMAGVQENMARRAQELFGVASQAHPK